MLSNAQQCSANLRISQQLSKILSNSMQQISANHSNSHQCSVVSAMLSNSQQYWAILSKSQQFLSYFQQCSASLLSKSKKQLKSKEDWFFQHKIFQNKSLKKVKAISLRLQIKCVRHPKKKFLSFWRISSSYKWLRLQDLNFALLSKMSKENKKLVTHYLFKLRT